MTRLRRNDVGPAVAALCHDLAMGPSWLIMNHENSWTFSIFSSVAWFHFALPSEPSGQWAPTGYVLTGSRSKGISRQKHKSSPQLCHCIWLSCNKHANMEVMAPKPGGNSCTIIASRYRKQSFSPFFPILPSQKERTSKTWGRHVQGLDLLGTLITPLQKLMQYHFESSFIALPALTGWFETLI